MNKATSRWNRIQSVFQRPFTGWFARTGKKGGRLLSNLYSRKWLRLERIGKSFEHLVSFLLRLGTLALILFLLLFIARLFKDQGYVLDRFSVPKALDESGYNGQVVALRILDEVQLLKEQASTIKEDSLELQGIQEDLNLDVLGVGLSLRSLTYQLRSILGRENKTIRGEITRVGERYEMKLRMTDYEPATLRVVVGEDGEAAALDQLFRKAGEQIIGNTDPYRLALICNNNGRYEEGIQVVRKIIRERSSEAHWGYLAWGSILENLGKDELAAERFRKSVELQPDFSLGWLRLSYALEGLGQRAEAIETMRKVVELEPENPWRINNYAWLLSRAERYAAADSAFAQALSVTKNREDRIGVCLNWAESKFNREDLAGALALVEEYEEEIGESVMGYITRAFVSIAREDTLQATKYVNQAFELDPSDQGAINVAITSAQSVDDHDRVIDIYRRANLRDFNAAGQQSFYNKAAMAFNGLEQHDSAFALIRRTIDMNPTTGYPYSTLAETFAFTGQMDSCWYYLEKAFIEGMLPSSIELDYPPYPLLATKPEFQALFEKYRKDTDRELAD